MPARAALYIDAFNQYHAIVGLNQNHLKWSNLWRMGELIMCSPEHQLTKVVFCTAYNKKDYNKLTRHQKFVRALESVGVQVKLGHFITEPRDCRECGHTWQEDAEKQTDINLAISLIEDAHRDEFDVAYLLSADSDQAATARHLKESFPGKGLVSVCPPGRQHSKNLVQHCDAKVTVSQAVLERSLFPRGVKLANGNLVVRPTEYDPPDGWNAPK